MKIYNVEKTKVLKDYDPAKGHLEADVLLVAHHEAIPERVVKTPRQLADKFVRDGGEVVEYGEHIYAVDAVYENGGKAVHELLAVIEPAVPAWDETEQIYVYVPYTERELATMEIDSLQAQFAETNDAAIMFSTGEITDEEWTPIAAHRKELRERIEALKKSLIEE